MDELAKQFEDLADISNKLTGAEYERLRSLFIAFRSAALEEAAKVADAEMLAARNMDAVHVSASARGIAHAIRALKDKPHE